MYSFLIDVRMKNVDWFICSIMFSRNSELITVHSVNDFSNYLLSNVSWEKDTMMKLQTLFAFVTTLRDIFWTR